MASKPGPTLLAAALLMLSVAPARAGAACSQAAAAAGWSAPQVMLGTGEASTFKALLEQLRGRRVVFIGEIHDRYDHHLNQLELICALAADAQPVAIAMEFFQQPFQAALERYANGHRDLDRLLRESEYFQRWGFDPRLYAPILDFAARRRIPMLAIGPPGETVARVSDGGADALHGDAAARLRGLVQRAPEDYVARLREVFAAHPGHETRSFEHFLAVQLLWDDRMAARASEYLSRHPRHRLLVLAGGGHVDFADAVPGRLAGVDDRDKAMVVQTRDRVNPGGIAPFVLRSTALDLPAAGRLGVVMDDHRDGVRIGGFAPSSAGRDAGLQKNDRLLTLDGRAIDGMAALRLALWRKRPGDLVDLSFARGELTGSMRFALR